VNKHHRLPSFRSILSLGHNEVRLPQPENRSLIIKRMPISQLPTQNLLVKLGEACNFIRNSIRNDCGGSVLVHCLDGLNLAPSVAVAYVMRFKSLDYDSALAIVRAAKPQSLPVPHFEEQLRVWWHLDFCIHDATGHDKLLYMLRKMGKKDEFKK
jgi:protein-tyrosine phosphatase